MDIALCYSHVRPERGGCETYISDLSRRLVSDGYRVHLLACDWDASALPESMRFHRLDVGKSPRFLKPWRFARACEAALAKLPHDVSVGFDKTWGQDILYPQGGLHTASAVHNKLKFRSPVARALASAAKWLDPAAWSFARLERRQYLAGEPSTVVVNSEMVRGHFGRHLGIPPERIRLIHSAIDPSRFDDPDRDRKRQAFRESLGVGEGTTLGLFVAMNYRLKGLTPLIHGLARVSRDSGVSLAVVGHPKFARYERLAQRLGVADRIHFVGFRRDPKEAYFASDFLVHPTFYDPCSLVVLEALACGLPVITSRHNGASELLDPPKDGLVVQDPHDAEELGTALASMGDGEAMRSRSVAARAAGRRWTFEQHYAALTDLFREVAGRRRAA